MTTYYVDTKGVALTTERVFVIHAAIEEMQSNGFLEEQTLQSLSHDELALVLQRTQEAR